MHRAHYLGYFSLLLAGLAGVALPLSTALQNITLPLMLIITLATPGLRQNLKLIWREPVVWVSLIFYALFVLGCAWSVAPGKDMFKMLTKMAGLLEFPFLLGFFAMPSYRRVAFSGFACGIMITLFFSYLAILTHHPMFHAKEWGLNYGIFRAHTYHCYFLAFFACWLLYNLLHKQYAQAWQRWLSILLLLLINHNIFFETFSRTGQILTIIMFMAILIQWRLKAGLLASGVILFAVVPGIIYFSPAVRAKIQTYNENVVQYQQGKFDQQNPSMFLRWTFHKYAKMLIVERPLFGHGTGSYPSEYASLSLKKHNPFSNSQPHSDYLWFGVELGLVGILSFILYLGVMLYRALVLSRPYRDFIIILLITYAVSCVENAYFTDSVSGLAFFLIAAVAFGSKYTLEEKPK